MNVASTKLTNPDLERLLDKCNDSGISIAEHLRILILKEIGKRDDYMDSFKVRAEGTDIDNQDENAHKNSDLKETNSPALKKLLGKRRALGLQR